MKKITTRHATLIEQPILKHYEIPEKPVDDDNISIINHKQPFFPKMPIKQPAPIEQPIVQQPIVPEDRKNVYGAQIDIANAGMILGDRLYKYVRSDVTGFTLPAFTANDIIVGGTGASGGIPDVNLNGAVRLAGASRDLTAQAVANYVNPINVYGGTVDINNAKNILGSTGYNYIDSSQARFVMPSFTSNDIVVGGTGATGGIPDIYVNNVILNGANRLAGINRDATAEAIRKYRDSKRVYGNKVDIDIAQSILGNDNYTYIRSDLPGFKLPIFCSNNIIVGGTGASGGIGDVNPNGAVRLAGASRDETADAIRRYAGVLPTPYPSNTLHPPNKISVLITATGQVEVVDFEDYVKNVLPNEWYTSWDMEALKAGAIAAKTYAWYWIIHQKYPCQGYDVKDSTADQVYRPGTATSRTDQAVEETWNKVMTKNGEIFQAQYDSGTKGSPYPLYAGRLSQWGTQYWAEKGKDWQWILNNYYDYVSVS